MTDLSYPSLAALAAVFVVVALLARLRRVRRLTAADTPHPPLAAVAPPGAKPKATPRRKADGKQTARKKTAMAARRGRRA